MRRWFAILLLALLPLQFSWAAVAVYCGHESDALAQHLGHHEHQHAGHASAEKHADPAGKDAPAGADLDCGHCHASCCSMPAPVDTLRPLAIASHPVTGAEGIVRTLAQSPPERPQWARFA